MSAQPAPELQRLLALLADRAVEGLPPARAAELAGLADHFPSVDGDALDRTAARIDLALAPQAGRSLTPALRRAILADLDRQSGVEVPRRPKAESHRRDPAAPRHGSASPAPAPPTRRRSPCRWHAAGCWIAGPGHGWRAQRR